VVSGRIYNDFMKMEKHLLHLFSSLFFTTVELLPGGTLKHCDLSLSVSLSFCLSLCLSLSHTYTQTHTYSQLTAKTQFHHHSHIKDPSNNMLLVKYMNQKFLYLHKLEIRNHDSENLLLIISFSYLTHTRCAVA
jgi:hypothetical protein